MDIFEACKTGNLERVKELIQSGVDVNTKNNDGIVPLHNATRSGYTDIVRELIAAGADVNIKNNDGIVPLHNATISGSIDIVRELIAVGADVNIKNNNGLVPLHSACYIGDTNVVYILIRAGADVNIKYRTGDTSLHFASESGHIDIVRALITAGANINIKNNKGQTAFDVTGNEDIKNVVRLPPPNTKCETLVKQWLNLEITDLILSNQYSPTIKEIDMLVTHSKGSVTQQEVIDCLKYENILISPEPQLNLETETCGICLSNKNLNIKDNKHPYSLYVLPCGHTFHKKCIMDNFKLETDNANRNIDGIAKHNCPLCRNEYNTEPKQLMLGGYYNKLQKYLNKLKV
jgi:hypothetical protein